MRIASLKSIPLFLAIATSCILLCDNLMLRSQLTDIQEFKNFIGQYNFSTRECCKKGYEKERKGNKTAILYYLFAGHKGDADAQFGLGNSALERHFNKNAERDEQWLLAAARQGNPFHQNALAAWYHNRGARNDAELGRKSFYWYKEAAMHNDPESMMMLGNYYRVGVGCEVNYDEAEYWLKKGMNHPDAHWTTTDSCRCELAEVYAQTGRREEAYDLLRTAIAQGDKRASEVLSYLKEEEAGQKGTPQSSPPSQP